ncbi:hypothetical protein L6164_019646 [Bauhinia variegata]|uniref:Uncharacterized protein n=1 Tax=Bauhinia variegata TaxID=167791 RepID=A0ACB9MT98_BAUVA|nr:hypothetical protein L6164_019646 [Bauhinia variegata]
MNIVWAGSRHAFQLSDRIARLVAIDQAFAKDRKELFKNTLRKTAHAWKRIIVLRLTEEEATILRTFVDEPAFTDLHWGMFVPTIKGQGTEEQQMRTWPWIQCSKGLKQQLPLILKRTSLLFIAPTLTSCKWWPGGLGKISTHAVVYARVITDGRDHGVNGFIVQLRSLDDHLPLPGITISDIGMKFGNGGSNTIDNGVLKFDHVRIPRNQMWTRVSQVTKDGKYVESNVPWQLVYGAMQNAGLESHVIDYKTQQARLFPLLASDYVFRFVGEWLKWLCMDVTQRLQANDFSTLPEDGIGECRKLCGGHGYLRRSGLPELFSVYVPACTYEGDNIVLLLQVASSYGSSGTSVNLMFRKLRTVLEAFEAQKLSKFTNPEEDLLTSCGKTYLERGVKHQLQILCSVYALFLLHKHRGDFLSTASITLKQSSFANDQPRSLYSQGQFLDAMMETCIQNCTRRHGRNR